MKKATFAILLTILITFACVFASCNANGGITGPGGQTEAQTDGGDYSSIIEELEYQILELKQNQYISESKRTEEISRLESLIMELKQSGNKNESDTQTDTNSSQDTEDSENTDNNESDTEDTTPAIFVYTVDNGKATITEFTGDDSALTIPSSIDGYDVVCIADGAFSSDTLKSVIIPEGVVKIGWFAFKDCSALRSVTIPKSVDSIGYSAFPAGTNGFSIICQADSFAARYAQSYGITVTSI